MKPLGLVCVCASKTTVWFGGIKPAQAEGKYKGRVPKAMNQADKVKALVSAGVDRVKVREQLGISKASYYRCLKVA